MNTNQTLNRAIISFVIESNGIDITDNTEVSSISIQLNKNGIHEATFTIISNNYNSFLFNNEIVISLGYDSTIKKVFTGNVVQKKFVANSNTGDILEITCKTTSNNSGNSPNNSTQHQLTLGIDIQETTINISDNEMRGKIEVGGSSNYNINDTIRLKGFNNHFFETSNIDVSVSSILHEVSPGNWTTTLYIVKNT